MSKRSSYSYSILRYVHDISTGEFVNVALVMYSRNATFLKFRNKSTTGRISSLFPNFKPSQFKALLALVRNRVRVIEQESGPNVGLWRQADSLNEILSDVLPKDDSSLVWSDISNGVSDDLNVTFEKMFVRYITRFDHKSQSHGKSDDDVWRSFKKDLEKRNLLQFFEPKKISGKDDEVEFQLAWKNGIWHCVEPISFDLSAPDSIREKAHKFLGQLTSVSDSAEQFKLYIVAAKPSNASLIDAYDKAIHILQKIPGTKEIYAEEESSALAELFSNQILSDLMDKEPRYSIKLSDAAPLSLTTNRKLPLLRS